VLRVEADPTASYVDGRCEALQALIETMAKELLEHNRDQWVYLNGMTTAIFKAKDAERTKKEETNKD